MKLVLYHKGFGRMVLVSKETLQRLPHTVVMSNQMETAQVGTMWVQVPVELEVQVMGLDIVAVDDEIYMLYQTCTVQFLNSRNTLFHPIFIKKEKKKYKKTTY